MIKKFKVSELYTNGFKFLDTLYHQTKSLKQKKDLKINLGFDEYGNMFCLDANKYGRTYSQSYFK